MLHQNDSNVNGTEINQELPASSVPLLPQPRSLAASPPPGGRSTSLPIFVVERRMGKEHRGRMDVVMLGEIGNKNRRMASDAEFEEEVETAEDKRLH